MKIKFNKKLYNKKAIKSSVEAFEGVCKFSIINEKNNHTVLMSKYPEQYGDKIKNEFCNFVLYEMRDLK